MAGYRASGRSWWIGVFFAGDGAAVVEVKSVLFASVFVVSERCGIRLAR